MGKIGLMGPTLGDSFADPIGPMCPISPIGRIESFDSDSGFRILAAARWRSKRHSLFGGPDTVDLVIGAGDRLVDLLEKDRFVFWQAAFERQKIRDMINAKDR